MMRMCRTLLATLVLALPMALHAQLGIEIGATAPDVMVETLDGKAVSLASAYKGRPAVIEFWATWCGPCKQSIPHINKIHRELAPKGLVVVGVSDETPEKVRPFVKQMGATMSYPVVVQKKDDQFMKEKWMKAAEQNGIPCAFKIGRASCRERVLACV